MTPEIIKLASDLFELVIESTKDNTLQWTRIDKLNDYDNDIFELVFKYVQKKLLKNQTLCNEDSYYTKNENIIFVLLCFKDIVSNEFIYELVATNNTEKLVVCSDYDQQNYSLRLGNLIKFQRPNNVDDYEDDVKSIRAIVDGFQDNG